MGRLTRDPEVRVTPTEKTVCSFTLAVDRPFSKDEADFINIVVWGKAAELCGNSLAKGHRLLVEGRLQIRNYVAKDGNKRYVTEVIADRVEFIERRNTNSTPTAPTAPATGAGEQHKEQGGMESFGKAVTFDEEIPF